MYISIKIKKGFNLAEILITLTVVGIVASLVISSLIQNFEDQHLKSAFKKAYSDISQATKLIMLDNGGDLIQAFSNSTDFINKFANKISTIRICPANQDAGICFHNGITTWHTLQGTDGWFDPTIYNRVSLNNGSIAVIHLEDANCTSNLIARNGINIGCGWIFLDVNGFKGPNITGKDIYGLYVTKYGTMPHGALESHVSDFSLFCKITGTLNTNGNGCAALVLINKPYIP